MMEELIVVAGPTAIGKTKIAISISEKINGEIISADSRQVYKFMDIGTAKPTQEEQKKITHHMIDIINPDEEIDVATYAKLARDCISDVIKHGKKPLLVGGTGLYIKGVIDGIFEAPKKDEELREKLKMLYDQDRFRLHNMLFEIDPESATRIHPNDQQRVIRALEVYHTTGKTISTFQKEHKFADNRYNIFYIGLKTVKSKLIEDIDKRVDLMFEYGFVDEVKKLIEMKYGTFLNSMQGLGYRHIASYLDKEITLEEAIYKTKKDTVSYAKRQMTWFKKDKRIRWFMISDSGSSINSIDRIIDLIFHKEEVNV
jgi:tRNA dimethylallyltransferase